jgi:outer membrane protein OmpA-like peptidoglycan-associated protein
MRLTVAGKITVLIVIAGLLFGGYRFLKQSGSAIGPAAPDKPTVNAPKIDLPTGNTGGDGGTTGGTTTTPVALPGSEPGCAELTEVRLLGYAWNAHMGLHFANGGPQAAKNSLMCKNGVNLKYARQDDNSKLTEALVTFATELKNGNPQPKKGAHFVTVMGDGSPAFIKGLNDALRRIGPEYQCKIIGAAGFSRGEDKFMGPPEWKANPRQAMGGVVAGVLRDGDWNIAQKWLGDNGLRTNTDEKTYDPDALNWVSTNDYLDAAEKYITGYSEERPVVRNGKRTGEKKRITVNGVVTWTPGDVNVATKKGGLVSIVSTKEYSTQMPCVIIGIDKWMKQNRKIVEGMLTAIGEGSDQIKNNPAALDRGAEISAAVYKEEDGTYWKKYFNVVKEADKTGLEVELGGSSVNNIADMLLTFGLAPGSANTFAATYQVFGEVVVAQYPDIVPSVYPVEQILDMSYLRAIAARNAAKTTAAVAEVKAEAKATFTKKTPIKTISRKQWNIPFQTGRAVFSPAATKGLQQMKRDLLVAGNTVVELHGHTDNVGDPRANQQLSESRAFAVKQWLEKQAPANFPEGRIRVFAHGQSNPVAPNSTDAGRARNRRVEVIIGAGA